MVLSTKKSSPETLVEPLRTSPIQQVANEPVQELKEYSFGLYQSSQDLELSIERVINNPPSKCTEFCLRIFKGKTTSQLKMILVFQITHHILTNGKEPTPFHVMAMQSLTQSKQLVTSLNHHGISVSYNTVKQIDVDLAEQIVTTAGDNGSTLLSRSFISGRALVLIV